MTSIDNPASRLTTILSEALKIGDDKPCRSAWAEIFGIAANDNSELFLLLGKVMTLPGEVAQLVQLHFPHQAPSISLWKDPIEAAFLHQNLQSNWQSFRQHLNPYCVPQLHLIADLLHTKLGASIVDKEQIEALIESFSALQNDVANSELPEKLKLYVLAELSTLVMLLRQYSVAGAEPVLRQADSMFGHIVRDNDYRSFLVDSELGKRLLDSLTAMSNVLTVAIGLPQLTVVITGLLT